MSDRRGAAGGVLLTALGGLALAGATTAPWVVREMTRAIGDAEVTETVATRGVELTRIALPLGLVIVVGGVLLAGLRRRPRRIVGGLVALVGAAAVIDVAVGALVTADGPLTAAPGVAAVGAVAALTGGWVAARTTRRPDLPARFDIDADEDDEWTAAVDPQEIGSDQPAPDDAWGETEP